MKDHEMIAVSTACFMFLQSLCARWIASAKSTRENFVFGHLIYKIMKRGKWRGFKMYKENNYFPLLKKNWDLTLICRDATEECPVSPSCGAKYPGFLEGSHPEGLEPGQEVQRTVCFAKSGNCCFRIETITIRKCQGFWIYKLPRPSLKGARYCGNKGNNLRNASYPCKELKKCIRE